jgi:hypothetical protein
MSTATLPTTEQPRPLTVLTLTHDQACRLVAEEGRSWRWPSGRLVRAAFLPHAFTLQSPAGGQVDAATGWGVALDQDDKATPYVVSPSIVRLWTPLVS